MNDPHRDPLSSLLRTWRHAPAADPAFGREVWKRIQQAPRRSRPLALALPLAASFAVLLGIGAGLATTRAQTTERMAAAYARSIDPLQMSLSHAP